MLHKSSTWLQYLLWSFIFHWPKQVMWLRLFVGYLYGSIASHMAMGGEVQSFHKEGRDKRLEIVKQSPMSSVDV